MAKISNLRSPLGTPIFLTLRVDRLIFLLFAMIKKKSRNLCLIQQLMNEMLKESLLSDDSRIIEQS